MLIAKQFSGAADAGLHFVKNEQQAALVAQLAKPEQINFIGDDDAAFGLNRFDEDPDGFLRIDRRFHRAEIVIRHLTKPGGQRIVTGADFFLARRGQSRQGAPVKRIVGRDDLIFAAKFFRTIAARQFDRRFVGFGAAVAEKRAVGEGMAAQLAGQLGLRLNMVEVRNVEQLLRLLFDRLDNRRMTVT